MERQPVVYSIKRWQLLAVLGALVLLVVSLPVGVYAATGQVVNLQDALNKTATGSGRVINQRLITNSCDINSTSITGANCTRIAGGRTLTESSPATPYAVEINGGTSSGDVASQTATVPAGKTFVVETVSGLVALAAGTPMYLHVRVVTAGHEVSYNLPLALGGTSGATIFYNSPLTNARLYGDPGSQLYLEAFRNSTSGPFSFQVQLSGHLV